MMIPQGVWMVTMSVRAVFPLCLVLLAAAVAASPASRPARASDASCTGGVFLPKMLTVVDRGDGFDVSGEAHTLRVLVSDGPVVAEFRRNDDVPGPFPDRTASRRFAAVEPAGARAVRLVANLFVTYEEAGLAGGDIGRFHLRFRWDRGAAATCAVFVARG